MDRLESDPNAKANALPAKLDRSDLFEALQKHFDPDMEHGGDAIWSLLNEYLQEHTTPRWQLLGVAAQVAGGVASQISYDRYAKDTHWFIADEALGIARELIKGAQNV